MIDNQEKVQCKRCGNTSDFWCVSLLNTDRICADCKKEERRHPQYDEARKAVGEAFKKGDFQYPGLLEGKEIDMIPEDAICPTTEEYAREFKVRVYQTDSNLIQGKYLKDLLLNGFCPSEDDYKLVWEETWRETGDDETYECTAEDVIRKLCLGTPSGFQGRNISAGDVLVLSPKDDEMIDENNLALFYVNPSELVRVKIFFE